MMMLVVSLARPLMSCDLAKLLLSNEFSTHYSDSQFCLINNSDHYPEYYIYATWLQRL